MDPRQLVSQKDEAKIAKEAKTTAKNHAIKSPWGRELKSDLDIAELYENDVDRVNRTHDIRSDAIDMFVIRCNNAIDNGRESELLDLISDAQCLEIDYLNLNISKGFSISPLEKICKSSTLLEKVSSILGVASGHLQSICKPKKLTTSERYELVSAFFTNIKNFRPSIYSLTDVLGYARIFSIDLKHETMEGMDPIQALCFSSHYTNEQRTKIYDLLSVNGIRLENIAEARQLIKFFSNDSNKIQAIEASLMIIKHASFVLEAGLIQTCILKICEPVIGRANSYWMKVAYKPSLLRTLNVMLDYIKECPDANSELLRPIITFCINHTFPKDVFELLRNYPHLMTSADVDVINKKITEPDLPCEGTMPILTTMAGLTPLSIREHTDKVKSPAKRVLTSISHTSHSFPATMTKRSVDESAYKTTAEEKLTVLLGKPCRLMHLYSDNYLFEFSSVQSYETLQKDAALLASKGITVTAQAPDSLCGGLVKILAKLEFEGSLSSIVTKLSSLSPPVSNSIATSSI